MPSWRPPTSDEQEKMYAETMGEEAAARQRKLREAEEDRHRNQLLDQPFRASAPDRAAVLYATAPAIGDRCPK